MYAIFRNFFATIIVLSVMCEGICAGSPRVWFRKSEIDNIREKVESDKFRNRWRKTLARARAYCDSQSWYFVDAKRPLARYSSRSKDPVVTHHVGRNLSRWMRTLGFVYQVTGNKRIGEHGVQILVSIAKEFPVTRKSMREGFAGGRGDTMEGLAFGYDMLGELMNEEQKQIIAETGKGYIENTISEAQDEDMWWYKYHNFNGVCAGGAGCLALALADQYPEKSKIWTGECIEVINRWLYNGFDEKGAYVEGVQYSLYGLSNTLLFADALLRCGGPNLFEHPHLRKVPHFYAMSLLPGENICEARNDSVYGQLEQIPLALAKWHGSGLAKWLWQKAGENEFVLEILWDNDVKAVGPVEAGEPLTEHFPDRGLCVWRTGWDEHDLMFSIEAGPYYEVTHNQGDKGHFTLYGMGYRWAADTGYGNDKDEHGRGQTVAHNCILIDGKGQAISGAGLGTSGKIIKYLDNNNYGYALADCSDAYNKNNKGQAGAKVQHALRHVFFIKPTGKIPAYKVILDDIVKDDEEHEFAWQMMMWNDIEVRITGDNIELVGRKMDIEVQRIQLFIDASSQVNYSVDTYDPGDNIIPSSLTRFRALTRAVNPSFAVVLVPVKKQLQRPKVTFGEADQGKSIRIKWQSREDIIIWTKEKCELDIGEAKQTNSNKKG